MAKTAWGHPMYPTKKKKTVPGFNGGGTTIGGGLTSQLAQPNPYSPITDALGLPGVDPALGYASASANLGLGYQNQDYNTNWSGMVTNPDGSIQRPGDLTATNPDGSPQYGRGLQDYFTNFDRANADYNTATGDLQHSYQTLGNNQSEAANQMGVSEGGALAQALAKRTANQAHDQSGLDTTHNRSLADLLTNTSRGATDAYTGLQRAVGSNSLYQGTIQTQAGQEAAPGLVDNPNYEVVGNTIYQRNANGSVTPVKKTTKTKTARPKRTVWGGHSMGSY